MLSPLLNFLHTYGCRATFDFNVSVKLADNTAVVRLPRRGGEAVTMVPGQLPVRKKKELIEGFRKRQQVDCHDISIDGALLERVAAWIPWCHIIEDLTWKLHTYSLLRKAHQRLHHLEISGTSSCPSQHERTSTGPLSNAS